ncbi:serine kinase [Sphingomonas sp. Root710]|uniref:serine kinase n=1 Tax=Sphingomonas sp. Root710 TaxID=1736594 RepID=UPI000B2D33BE|nr:serine kinase [Sphingomonas sp. Root710]
MLSQEDVGRAATIQQPPATEYFAFGLTIRSHIALPELSPSELTGREPDLTVGLAPCGRPPPPRDAGVVVDLDPSGRHYLAWPGVAAFRFDGLRRIDVEPYPGVPMSFLAFPLLGPVFGLLLHLRGLAVLHASAVEIYGQTAAFVGDKLAGKSTTAGAFIRGGHRLLTDDLLAIDLVDPIVPRILPAFAQLKLSDESSTAVPLANAEALPLAYDGFTKRQYRLAASSFSHRQLRLDHVFILDRGGDMPAIEPLHGFDALGGLMRFSYVSRFGKALLEGRNEADHLQRFARLSRQIAVSRLRIPADLSRLDETVLLIETMIGER